MSIKNELSNLSYTNKDFNSIYVELLEYAKKLSYKWDPSSSDESDPAVVLLKLAAIIGDKDNYNIDKNILELMPASVTQLPAAMQLFDQCGYSMKYYMSAAGFVNVTIKKNIGDEIDEKEDYTYTIPRFTMFSDSDKTVVYTTVKDNTLPLKTETPLEVIEGKIVKYSVNNDSLITTQNLDYDNRLYFSETNIAENGIFIDNVGSTKHEWKRVENIQIEPKGTPCYKFGVTIDTSVCYIEFPEDVELLVGEGLSIHYILTSGSEGNVSAGKIRDFYSDTQIFRNSSDGSSVSVSATTESVAIKNAISVGGADPESIDSAYKNYRRVRDTFNTLVSLKDYTDYLVTSGNASNGYVCDRTNDIQHTYKILTTSENSTYIKTVIDSSLEDGLPSMNAFNLCVYALQYVPTVTTVTSFVNSFKLFDMTTKNKGTDFNFAAGIKSLQHDYLGFEENKILMIKNKYPVTASIIPRSTLSSTEKLQVLSNVEASLCKYLNSNEINFGEGIPPEKIQEAILNADERIKNLIDFKSPEYETYVVYMNSDGEFKEIRVDSNSLDAGYVEKNVTRNTFASFDALYIKNPMNEFLPAESYDASKKYYIYDPNLSELWNKFRVEIFAKNILAGVTPLYSDANVYTFTANQTNIKEYFPSKISTNTNINLEVNDSSSSLKIFTSDEIRKNESILLRAPNLIEENSFSSYVKVLYHFDKLSENLIEDTKYELKDNDFIIFFWKTSDTSSYYNYIKYDNTDKSLAKFISPSGYIMSSTQDLSSTSFPSLNERYDVIKSYFAGISTGKGTTENLPKPATSFLPDRDYSVSEFINNCLKSDSKGQVLTGMHIIKTYNMNEIHINNNENGCSHVYWILNNVNSENKYVLFDSEDKTEYVLKSGEYFMYTNDSKTNLYLLGEGTLIKRSTELAKKEPIWSVESVDYDTLIYQGIDTLENKWKTLKKVKKLLSTDTDANNIQGLWAQEYQQILIGPKNKLQLVAIHPDRVSSDVITISSETPTSLANFKISYIDTEDNITSIPEIVSDVLAWKATSILNLDLSNEQPQVIQDGQSIKIYESESDPNSCETIESTSAEGSYRFIQTSQPLISVGNDELNTSSMFSSSLSMIQYDVESTLENPYEIPENIVITKDSFTKNEETSKYEYNIQFNLIEGTYLMHIQPTEGIENIAIITKNLDNDVTILNETTTCRLTITSMSSPVEITISVDSIADGASITIPKLFKYTKEILSSFDDTFEERLLEKIHSLDPNGMFNYSYAPKNPINNPLVSYEFLTKQHFYNSYTICEWDAKMTTGNVDNVTIHDVVR